MCQSSVSFRVPAAGPRCAHRKELPKSCNALSVGDRQADASTHSDHFLLRTRDCLDVLGSSLDARDSPMRMSSKASTVLADNVASGISDQITQDVWKRCLDMRGMQRIVEAHGGGVGFPRARFTSSKAGRAQDREAGNGSRPKVKELARYSSIRWSSATIRIPCLANILHLLDSSSASSAMACTSGSAVDSFVKSRSCLQPRMLCRRCYTVPCRFPPPADRSGP